MNAGIYHLNKEIIKELPVVGDIEKTVFPKFAKKEKLFTIKFRNCRMVFNRLIQRYGR